MATTRSFYRMNHTLLSMACFYFIAFLSITPITAFLCQQGVARPQRLAFFQRCFSVASSDFSNDIDDDEYDEPPELPFDNERPLDREDLEQLTLRQLQQQLRLRGLVVSGRKAELVERLLRASGSSDWSQSQQFAKEQGKELVDIDDYLNEKNRGKSIKSRPLNLESEDEEDEESNSSVEPEVWGAEARIVDDYEGRKIVVDSLTHNIIEFTGSNQTAVQTLVVASRDALKPFLAGGRNATRNPEEYLRQIQQQREQAARRPVRFEDESGLDEGDESGIFTDILHRDFTDWGKYTQTGAQVSAGEVQGVILLSDVYGAFTDDMEALAEKIAFECQPVVVMVPDLFRGRPWTGPTDSVNTQGQTYEQWRATHNDVRVNVDIRAAAACLRERYGVSAVVVWGTCYGGGRALEAASGWMPGIHDVDGSVGPPPVNPMAAIAWYPTRYNVHQLFGNDHQGTTLDLDDKKRQMAVMAVFAGKDTIPGATKTDAAQLKLVLEQDERVKDHMVKVFPDQCHGFAHQGISQLKGSDDFDRFVDEEFGGAGRVSVTADGDAEVACLLSTAFMETYSRVFLPTVGPPISLDEKDAEWGQQLEMKNYKANERDVRREIEDAVENFVEEPLGGYRIDPTDESQEEELKKLLRSMQDPAAVDGPYAIDDGDDLPTIYAKLTADDNFQIF